MKCPYTRKNCIKPNFFAVAGGLTCFNCPIYFKTRRKEERKETRRTTIDLTQF